jgi:hypothetical protein
MVRCLARGPPRLRINGSSKVFHDHFGVDSILYLAIPLARCFTLLILHAYASSGRARALRPLAGAGRVWSGLRRGPSPSGLPRRRDQGNRNSPAACPPRSGRLRSLYRRWRGHLAPASTRVLRAGARSCRGRAPQRRGLRRRPMLSFEASRGACRRGPHHRRGHPPSQPEGYRVARRARQRGCTWTGCAVVNACLSAGLHRVACVRPRHSNERFS